MFFNKGYELRGIKPRANKHLTAHKAIENADVPNIAYIPISQSLGKSPKVIIHEGQRVEEGQLIAEAVGPISANVHSSIPGKVAGIQERYTATGKKDTVVVIELEGEFRKSGYKIEIVDWHSFKKEDILKKIKEYGIVGLGGSAFPTHLKLSASKNHNVDTIIINGAESEPYLTCDHRLMIDKSEDLLEGITIINKIYEASNIFIAIESNKTDAIKRLKALCLNKYNIKVVPLKVKYPHGDERKIIKAVLGKTVAADKFPLDIGIAVFNVGTVVAIKEAIVNDKPLIERVVTFSGSGIVNPKNLKVKIGTLLSEVVQECGGLKPGVKKIIIGGPMMGIAQMNLEIPMAKNISAVLAFTEDEYDEFLANSTCISCGKCISACAYGLMPVALNRLIKYKQYEDTLKQGLMYCKECGACAWVCPARIPLVQNFKMGKDIVNKLINTKQG